MNSEKIESFILSLDNTNEEQMAEKIANSDLNEAERTAVSQSLGLAYPY